MHTFDYAKFSIDSMADQAAIGPFDAYVGE